MINLTLDKITHTSMDRNEETPRDIVVISGIPFYRSSGKNSGSKSTWFPFLGIQSEGAGNFGRGYYEKIHRFDPEGKVVPDHYFPEELAKKVEVLGGSEILTRFSSLPALLISSLLGGGKWDYFDSLLGNYPGQELKKHLENTYPEFYKTWPALTVAQSGEKFAREEIEAVNSWILEKTNHSTLADLETHFVTNLEKLELPQHVKHNTVISDKAQELQEEKDTKKTLQKHLIDDYNPNSLSKKPKISALDDDWVDLAEPAAPQAKVLPSFNAITKPRETEAIEPSRKSFFRFW